MATMPKFELQLSNVECPVCGSIRLEPNPRVVRNADLCYECYSAALVWAAKQARAGRYVCNFDAVPSPVWHLASANPMKGTECGGDASPGCMTSIKKRVNCPACLAAMSAFNFRRTPKPCPDCGCAEGMPHTAGCSVLRDKIAALEAHINATEARLQETPPPYADFKGTLDKIMGVEPEKAAEPEPTPNPFYK